MSWNSESRGSVFNSSWGLSERVATPVSERRAGTQTGEKPALHCVRPLSLNTDARCWQWLTSHALSAQTQMGPLYQALPKVQRTSWEETDRMWEPEDGRRAVKGCLLEMAWLLYSLAPSSYGDPLKIKLVKIPEWLGEGWWDLSLPAEELLEDDGCWRRKSQPLVRAHMGSNHWTK